MEELATQIRDMSGEGTVGRLIESVNAAFSPEQTVAETIEALREKVKTVPITYVYVIASDERLLGVVTMRDLLFSDRNLTLGEVMLRDPFALWADLQVEEAMKRVLDKHYPVYPIVDATGRLRGLVRGQTMFAARAIEISAQPGAMVGVEKEERLSTRWQRSLVMRHPWLQLNLLTAFLAAAVVGAFQGTLDRLVILAIFLPVLAGQSGNTGCQALAVTLRGITLGELEEGGAKGLVGKEARLGFFNGALVGFTAGIGMFFVAKLQGNPDALMLGGIVALAMTG